MLTQEQADRLVALMKEATRTDLFVWEKNKRQDEKVVSIGDEKIEFILSLKHNPLKIRLHFRTRDRNNGLVCVDNKRFHTNPDGTEVRNQPHLHVYREGEDLDWAEPVDWYNLTDPMGTLERFLQIIRTRFPSGYQLDMF